MISAKLTRMPDTIILIDQHNIAKVGTKMAEALKRNFTVHHLLLRDNVVTPKQVKNAFRSDPKKTLIIIMEPGDLAHSPKKAHSSFLYHKVLGITRPRNIPFALFWSGSIYRISNYAVTEKLSKSHTKYLRNRRAFIDSTTPLIMCGTADLTSINSRSVFIGQPYSGYPQSLPKKDISKHKIIHVQTNPKVTNFGKGTDRVRKAFNMLDGIVDTEITKWRTPHEDIIKKMNQSTMCVHAMNDWGGAWGYAGIEASATGCLVFVKVNFKQVKGLMDSGGPNKFVNIVKKLVDDPDEFNRLRKEQFEFCKNHFTNKSFANTVEEVIRNKVRNGWK